MLNTYRGLPDHIGGLGIEAILTAGALQQRGIRDLQSENGCLFSRAD